MVHVGALPGTPQAKESIDRIVGKAVAEAGVLAAAGFDGVMVENMHDAPYIHGEHGPEIAAVMTRVALAVRAEIPGLLMGVQVLSGGNREAIAVAATSGCSFIRCENFVFSHVADEGLLPRAEAGPLLRYRRSIGADGSGSGGRVAIVCDLKKKHASHAITADISLADAAEAAEFFGADGLVVTGSATGKPTRVEDVAEVRAATRLPVFVGSGVTPESVSDLFEHADALIVGSSIKRDGHWSNPVDSARCRRLVAAAARARRGR
jgi:membrane complex biogenesis BtpA family protein